MSIRDELAGIVGAEHLRDDQETLEKYSKDQSFVSPRMPDWVVFPKNREEVQEIVKLANRHLLPIVPYSSGLNLRGATIPDQGGIIMDFFLMNKILEVDERNWHAVVEPGVTYEQFQNELESRGFYAMIPMGVPPKRSVLSSYLERDPMLSATSFECGNDRYMDTEIVLPDGEIFRTGLWAVPEMPAGNPYGPITPYIYRLWMAAQGTLGIITKMVIKIERRPNLRKVFFLTFNKLEDAIEPIRTIQRREIGLECFMLNSFNLAAILNEDWAMPESFPSEKKSSQKFEEKRKALPPWTFMISLSGLRFPEDKIRYEEKALREACAQVNVELQEGLPGITGLEKIIEKELYRPWSILKKFRYRGSVHSLSFLSPMGKIAEFEKLIRGLAEDCGYPTQDIGGFALPIERARSCYLEYDLHCDPNDQGEREKVLSLWSKASEELLNRGALIDRPYGPWADMVFRRADATYVGKLKDLKAKLDPNNVLNPGKLCF